MGSTWVTIDKVSGMNIPFIVDKPDMAWFQFVPGTVTAVVTNTKHTQYKGDPKNINSIMANSHYSIDPQKAAVMSDKNRYFPLLRGAVDVPTIGDPVLLCTFGEVQYYLGPLNADGNPTWNKDPLNEAKALSENNAIASFKKGEEHLVSRLQKKYNKVLDDPNEERAAVRNIHGDLIFEGRHGNGIRIGSRNIHPHIIISNGRFSTKQTAELWSEGSILGMFEYGAIRQHFTLDSKIVNGETISVPFILASDSAYIGQLDRKRKMEQLISHVNNGEDATKIIYDYGKQLTKEEKEAREEPNKIGSQIFLNSDRIIINSKNDSLFLSAAENVHIGAGNTLTISTENETIIESSNVYLGKQAKETAPSYIEGVDVQQGIVLGENLREWLAALIDLLVSSNGHCQGAPIPLGVENGPPGSLIPKLIELKNLIIKDSNDIVSTKHFIEDNEER